MWNYRGLTFLPCLIWLSVWVILPWGTILNMKNRSSKKYWNLRKNMRRVLRTWRTSFFGYFRPLFVCTGYIILSKVIRAIGRGIFFILPYFVCEHVLPNLQCPNSLKESFLIIHQLKKHLLEYCFWPMNFRQG